MATATATRKSTRKNTAPPEDAETPVTADAAPEPEPTPDPTEGWTELEQEVPATAGHGPARAAAYLAIAEAFGAVGTISGSTRSTGPEEGVYLNLKVPDAEDVRKLEDIFNDVSLQMEDAARVRRAKARDEFKAEGTLAQNTYALNLASRSTMVGFGQGVASALAKARGIKKIERMDGQLTPVAAARFRKHNLDDNARRSGFSAGQKFARENLLPSEQPAITAGEATT